MAKAKFDSPIPLGASVRDTITGLTGVLIGITFYLHSRRVGRVQPPCGPDRRYHEPVWFDLDRLSLVEDGAQQPAPAPAAQQPAPAPAPAPQQPAPAPAPQQPAPAPAAQQPADVEELNAALTSMYQVAATSLGAQGATDVIMGALRGLGFSSIADVSPERGTEVINAVRAAFQQAGAKV